MKRISGVVGAIVLWCGLCALPAQAALPEVLSQFDFHIVGLGLKAAPEYQAVPKGIATQVMTGFDAGDLDVAAIVAQLPQDYTVRAELSGPAFATPLTLVTRPGSPFDLPSLAINGRYTLANIRLVDGNGTTLFGAVPQAVAIESIPDPLITSVTTRPLTAQELEERGVTFDSSNFTAYQFTAGIATASGQVPLNLPVVIPTSHPVQESPELVAPSTINISVAETVVLPPEVPETVLPPNLEVKPFLMEVDDQEAVRGSIEGSALDTGQSAKFDSSSGGDDSWPDRCGSSTKEPCTMSPHAATSGGRPSLLAGIMRSFWSTWTKPGVNSVSSCMVMF